MLDPAGLRSRGYTGILQVGPGSANPGRMVVLRHVPAKASKETIALVGKGITFDSGGISLKPGDKMWEMKGDMAGAAAVLYAMRALGTIKPDVQGRGHPLPRREHARGDAQRPGDIFTAKNGKSVMVDNTDAEGRLMLTDGLARAGRRARRTSSTSPRSPAPWSAPSARASPASWAPTATSSAASIRSGENHGERFWELPLVEEYRESLKTPVRRHQQHLVGWAGRRHHRRAVPARVRARRRRVGAPRHRRAHVPRQGLEVLRGRRPWLRSEDARGSVRALP